MMRVAIVGAGPSGMYVAEALLKADPTCEVTLIERLVSPYGLLRGGVAPDHQKMKGVATYYERIMTQFGARCHYMGNVPVGQGVTLHDLRAWFDAVVVATGASEDRALGIEGESMPGIWPATRFVSWVNGHPDGKDTVFDWSTARHVVVIGQGNVAVDVVRLLAKPVSALRATDIPEDRLTALAGNHTTTLSLIGRRGPVQAAFTELELQELGHIPGVSLRFHDPDFELGKACMEELEHPDANKARKNWAALHALRQAHPIDAPQRTLSIRFFESPVAFVGTDRVTGVVLERNQLQGPAGQQKAIGTGVKQVIPADMVFKSVGYRSVPLPGCPFSPTTHTVPHQQGQVFDLEGQPVPGLFVAGWAKRGPSGVLGTNKPCGAETARTLLAASLPSVGRQTDAFKEWVTQQGIRWVSFDEWKQIDEQEVARGQALGKPREKWVDPDDMIRALS